MDPDDTDAVTVDILEALRAGGFETDAGASFELKVSAARFLSPPAVAILEEVRANLRAGRSADGKRSLAPITDEGRRSRRRRGGNLGAPRGTSTGALLRSLRLRPRRARKGFASRVIVAAEEGAGQLQVATAEKDYSPDLRRPAIQDAMGDGLRRLARVGKISPK